MRLVNPRMRKIEREIYIVQCISLSVLSNNFILVYFVLTKFKAENIMYSHRNKKDGVCCAKEYTRVVKNMGILI